MSVFLKAIGRLFGRLTTGERLARAEALRDAHRRRCHNFKVLTAANNRALETMADMEECLAGGRFFGASAVRQMCTRAASEVYRMVRALGEITPGAYQALPGRFKDIQGRIHEIIRERALPAAQGPLVLDLEDIGLKDMDEVGGKMAALGEVRQRLGLAVPEGFVVTASAFCRLMAGGDLQTEIDRRIQQSGFGSAEGRETLPLDQVYALSSSLQQCIIASPLPEDLRRAVADRLRAMAERFGPGLRLAVRSSAVGEDSLGASFAGQYQTELGVAPDEAVQAYREVVAAKYGVPGMTYRAARGIRDQDVPMCVGCLRMVDAAASGVAYSRDPMDFSGPQAVIEAVAGLPKTVVDGSAETDAYRVERGDPFAIVFGRVAVKATACGLDPAGGVRLRPLDPAEGARPALTEAQVLEVARLAVRLEEALGRPQDVEWALDQAGTLYVLQCRPLREASSFGGPESAKDGEVQAALPQGVSPEAVLLAGGRTASPGSAAGPVFAAAKDADALSFPDGAVLVVVQALPRWAPLLPRAAAVVTEQGSPAGHLANVAREYGLPALMGAAGAWAALAKAGTVTVDADRRLVCRGEVPELLVRRAKPANPMLGSPVYETLRRAAELVVPLNLLDPDGPDFRPEACATLHDMTRYCHEMAVVEMFETGHDREFVRHFARRLVVKVPMQYWVIDLDDGLARPAQGDRNGAGRAQVTLEEIVSAPMLALWRGMTAVPWAGPPAPPDVRSFMSVLAESTTNTDLDPAMASGFAVKNYFMISRDFCSLQARFGYHFCTVEALVGDNPDENYASFRFKGGAADLERRIKRARFVEDILDAYGFRCDVRRDALAARVEGRDRRTMEDRLAVLGHIVVHTRQLDLIMNDEAEVGRRRLAMVADIASGLGVEQG